MKKTILATAIVGALAASAGALATSQPPSPGGDSATASIIGIGGVTASAGTSAFASGNGSSIQVSGASATNTLRVNANANHTPTSADASLAATAHGTTGAYAAGNVTGNAFGSGYAGAAQGDIVLGHASVRTADMDMEGYQRRCKTVGAQGGASAGGGVVLGGAQGSFAGVKNTNTGFAAQVSGAGFQNSADVSVVADVDAANRGPSSLDLTASVETAGSGYSYVSGIQEGNGQGISGAGYLQGSAGSAYGSGSISEYSNNRATGSKDYASLTGNVSAKAKQGSAGGAINIGNGEAVNASVAEASQTSVLAGQVKASDHFGAGSRVTTATTDSASVASTFNEYDAALSGTIAGATAEGNVDAVKYVESSDGPSDCYVGCKPRKPAKGNNGFGNGPDSNPPGHDKNGGGAHSGQDD